MLTRDELVAVFEKSKCFSDVKEICQVFSKASLEDSKNVARKDAIAESCLKHGWAEYRDLNCKEVGGVSFNRGGEGVLWARAHTRLQVIKNGGMSFKTIANNLVALEDDPLSKAIAKYTCALNDRKKRYAPYEEHRVKAGNLGATHCNHGFACAKKGVPCNTPMLSSNAVMDKQEIVGADKNLPTAIDG